MSVSNWNTRNFADTSASPLGATTGGVTVVLRLEGLLALAVAVAGYRILGQGWLMFALLFLTPDLSMLGYLIDSKVGATAYNVGHSYLSPGVLALAGLILGLPLLLALALIWVAHIGFDRALGYGLKYPTAFGATHLGLKGRGA
jgi:hypothetical protein